MDKAINPNVWLQQAKSELDVAKHLDEIFRPKPMEIICFHAQQAAEKSVKAVILKQSTEPKIEKKHDISVLLDHINQKMTPFDDEFYEYADELFPYSVITRYPNQLQNNIDDFRVSRALSHAEKILNWAAKAIGYCSNDSTETE